MRIPRLLDAISSRVKLSITEEAWPAVRTVTSLRGTGPIVGVPSLRRAIVVAPHPDDETIGVGGTLSLLAEAGTAVTVVVLTNGEMTPGTGLSPAEVGRRRTVEAREACRRLGLGEPRFLALPDGGLAGATAEVVTCLRSMTAAIRPDALFLPWFGDGHPDHRAVTTALAGAAPPPNLVVWAYEVWSPLPANRLVEITSAMPRKEHALAAHVTAGQSFDLHAMLGLSRYRSVHGLAGHGFAEAFLVAGARRYLDLAAAMGGGVAASNK